MMIPDVISKGGRLVEKTYTTAYQAAYEHHDSDVRAGLLAAMAVQYAPGQRDKATSPQADERKIGLRNSDGQHSCATCYFNDGGRCHLTGSKTKNDEISDFYLFEDAVFYRIPDTRSWLTKWRSRPFAPDTPVGFKVFSVRGQDLWIAWYTNPYRDREGEYFAEVSLDADIKYMQTTGDFPELWFYHIPGSFHGKAHWVDKIGRLAVAIGTFADTPITEHMKRYYKQRDMRISHGYVYSKRYKKAGVYYLHHTYEVSPLPAGTEANPYTSLFLGEILMGVDAKQLAEFIEALNGDEALAKQMIELGQAQTAKLEAMGVDRKSQDEADTEAKAKNLVMEAVTEAQAPLLDALTQHTKALTALTSALSKGKGSSSDEMEDTDEEDDANKAAAPVVPPAPVVQNPQIEAVIAETQARQSKEFSSEALQGGEALLQILAGRAQNNGGLT